MNDTIELTNLADAFSFDAPKKEEVSREQVKQMMLHVAAITNQQWGHLDKQDGYNCPICRNKGELFKVYTTEGAVDKDGNPISVFSYEYMRTVPCKCMEKRQGYQRSRMSGLPEGYTFETFKITEDWQHDMKRLCERYLNDKAYKNGSWLYIGGAIGAGKSHIVSALARELVYERNVVYMNWVRDATRLKASVNDHINYEAQLYRLVNAEVLFVDDFFKAGYVTDADRRLAYDILNERYSDHLPTLFTSEMFIQEIEKADESIASRIFERAKDYMLSISRDKSKDMRRK